MRLGEILLKRELVTATAISEALERQKTNGGRLGANLIALGYLTEEQLSSVIHGAPAAPNGTTQQSCDARKESWCSTAHLLFSYGNLLALAAYHAGRRRIATGTAR